MPRIVSCFSYYHYLLIANLRNFHSGSVSLQYHIVFDDIFQILSSVGGNGIVVDDILNNLVE